MPLAAFDGPTPAKGGPPKPGAPAAAKSDDDGSAAGEADKVTKTAKRMLEAGVKHYEEGDTDEALRGFNEALRSGALTSQEVARALYYRGLTQRKDGKPGLAISDLTSAIWLKDGLTPAEKQEALRQRAAAYQAAGISSAPEMGLEASVAAEAAQAAASPNAGGWQTAGSGGGDAYSPSASYAAPPQAVASAPPAASSSGGGIGGFFNSITGGIFSSSSGSSEPATEPVPAATAAMSASEAPGSGAPVRGPEVSSWSQSTQVDARPETAPVTTVAAYQQKQREVPPPTVGGNYLLQVAAVRSRSEADMLVARLLTQYGGELGGRDPSIDEAAIGSMGTFYRVRVGPYASASEPKHLCSTLQAGGFDCLVVTQ